MTTTKNIAYTNTHDLLVAFDITPASGYTLQDYFDAVKSAFLTVASDGTIWSTGNGYVKVDALLGRFLLDIPAAQASERSTTYTFKVIKKDNTVVTEFSGSFVGSAGTSVEGVTASAAEMNLIDGSVAGTAVASKAAVLGANKNLDTIAIAEGGLKVGAGAGTAVTGSAAELNLLDGSIVGTAVASKAAALGANKELDEFHTAALYLGAAACTLVTPTAAEINVLNGAAMDATFVVGAEGGNVINVAVQLKDAAGGDLAVRSSVPAYLSSDAAGDSIAVAAPSGGAVIGTDGLAIPMTPALTNALLVDGNLAIDAVAEKFKTTQSSAFLIGGVSHVKAPETALLFSAAHVITASKFGVILVQINAAGTISSKVPGSPQAYNDAPTALAALPAADAGNIAIGYIAIENNAGDWTANTDDLTNASDVTTAAFNDSSETAVAAAKAWQLVSESDGDIDVNITEAGVATWYLVLVLANGKLAVSDAITFA